MEKVISDGVIRIIVRELRDNLDEVPLGLLWWQRRYQTEPWLAAQGIAAVRNAEVDGVTGVPANYWYGKVTTCMEDGLALALFVGHRTDSGYRYGQPASVLLALPDARDPARAVLLHHNREAFGGEEGERAMLAIAREWAGAMGRKLQREVVTREWKDA